MITVNKVSSDPDLEAAHSIRNKVFVIEQRCPPELEWEFENESTHFIASFNGVPAGAARWRITDKGFKLERFCVLKDFRGKGVAQALISAVLDDLPASATYVYLNAQVQAIKLYQKFGFESEGDSFEEAGIEHYKMVMRSRTHDQNS